MAREDQRSEKLREDLKSQRLFATGSSESGDVITSASMAKDQKSFEDNLYITDYYLDLPDGTSPLRSLTYMMQLMQEDIEDLHTEVSASVYAEQVSEFSNITTGSFNYISSSLTPNADNIHDLGASGKEWKDLYVDGIAYIDSINGGKITGPIVEDVITFTAGDTTPSVNGGNIFKTANTARGTADITGFDNGVEGQKITILINDDYTDFTNGGCRASNDLALQRARDWDTSAATDSIVFIHNGTCWVEISRSDNT